MSFYEELKRRNVAKVAVLYIIAAWLLLQVTDVLSSLLTVPEWTGSLVVLLLLLGFFPVMIFSWVYEMTPEGLKKEKDIDRSQSITPETGRKINTLIIVLLVLAIGGLIADRLMPEKATIAETRKESTRESTTQIKAGSPGRERLKVDSRHDSTPRANTHNTKAASPMRTIPMTVARRSSGVVPI